MNSNLFCKKTILINRNYILEFPFSIKNVTKVPLTYRLRLFLTHSLEFHLRPQILHFLLWCTFEFPFFVSEFRYLGNPFYSDRAKGCATWKRQRVGLIYRKQTDCYLISQLKNFYVCSIKWVDCVMYTTVMDWFFQNE